MKNCHIVLPHKVNYHLVEGRNMSIGENLRRLRRDKSLTQGALSELCGVKSGHLSQIENDQSDPKLSTIYSLIKALGCTPNELLMNYKEIGIDTALALTLERMSKLDERDKTIIIDVIDKYCIANGLSTMITESSSGRRGLFGGYMIGMGPVDSVIPKK